MMQHNRFFLAVEDFRQARRDAALEEIVARLRGRSAALLPFEQVREQLKAHGSQVRGLQDIPLDAIIGSVGRYSDFTRSFLPRHDSDEERWAQVQVAMTDLGKFPPINVYQIGEAYFVIDGNHRISIARQLGVKTIQAYVTELESKVPLSPDDNPNDFIIKAEYADFLEQTKLDECSKADLLMTVAGGYQSLLQQIEDYHDYIAQNRGHEVSYTEAACQWYNKVYLPIIKIIRQRGILREFVGRTEADFYRWMIKHRAALQEKVGWDVPPEAVVSDLAAQYSPTRSRMVARLGAKVKDALALHDLMGGPEPGLWRKEHILSRPKDHLLADILVALSGKPSEWQALEQALLIAKREEARILGLHIGHTEGEDRLAIARLEDEFQARCEKEGVVGEFAIEYSTQAAALICSRARWSDLVVTKLAYPPAAQPLAKIKSGFRRLVRRSPRPLLAVPAGKSQLERPLLAYDGSPKAKEALFLAAYLAGKWQKALSVITIETALTNEQQLEEARHYLEAHDIEATYLYKESPAAEAILRTAEDNNNDLIIIGGYGFGFMREVVLGSAVDGLLRGSQIPMLICR